MRRHYNMRDAILKPETHEERLLVAEQIVREVLAEHGTPGRVLDDQIVKKITEVTVSMIEASLQKAKP